MRKLGIVVLAMLLVASLTSLGFAATTASVDVNVTVEPYFETWFDTPNDYDGLFGNTNHTIGEPGIYVSNGGTTRNSVLQIWHDAINTAEANGIESGEINQGYYGNHQVELFKVDANTMVDITLDANFDNWMNAPTLFRVSSSETAAEINGYGNWAADLAWAGNIVSPVTNPDYNPLINDHNTAVNNLDDTFSLDFGGELLCHGPLDFHVNGAIWMPKASQVAAGDYEATVTVTVAAAAQ